MPGLSSAVGQDGDGDSLGSSEGLSRPPDGLSVPLDGLDRTGAEGLETVVDGTLDAAGVLHAAAMAAIRARPTTRRLNMGYLLRRGARTRPCVGYRRWGPNPT
jgi:hypothetical protein